MTTEKRNRSLNWDEEERQLLRTVLKDYAAIKENKSLDANSTKMKNIAWQEVHKKFNELNSRRREQNQLQSQWKTMKIAARKAHTEYKKETKKTGGGPPPASPNQELVETEDLLHPAELLKDCNKWDSDGLDMEIIDESQPLASASVDHAPVVPCVARMTTPLAARGSYSRSAKPELPPSEGLMVTPVKTGTNAAKRAPKRKILSNKDDYVSKMIEHSKLLKDEDHRKQLERADEEHQIKMAIHHENLRAAILKREILEIRKTREQKECMLPPTSSLSI